MIIGAKFSLFACMSYFCDVNFESEVFLRIFPLFNLIYRSILSCHSPVTSEKIIFFLLPTFVCPMGILFMASSSLSETNF